MPPCPEDLAKLLKVYSHSPDDPPILYSTAQVVLKSDELYTEVGALETLELQVFSAQFNSRYLPAVIELCMSSYPSTHGPVQLWEMHVEWLAISTGDLGTLARFIREDEDQSKALYVFLAAALGRFDITGTLGPVPRDVPGYITSLLALLDELGMLLIQQIPTLSFLPLINARILADINTLLPQLLRSSFIKELPVALARIKMISACINQRCNPAAIRDRILQGQIHYVWLKCELLAAANGSLPPCQSFPQGEEMQACGRCRAVRYCSPEHQKLDWKRHKQFAPRAGERDETSRQRPGSKIDGHPTPLLDWEGRSSPLSRLVVVAFTSFLSLCRCLFVRAPCLFHFSLSRAR